jgi:glycosyltransferase involved in cell wall biosynthesis
VILASDFFVRYSSELARGLAENGATTLLLTREHDLEFGGRPGAMRAYVSQALEGKVAHVELHGRVREFAGLRSALRARRRVGESAPDVVHLQDGAANDPRLIAVSGARRRRYAITVHDPVIHPGDRAPDPHVGVARRALIRGAGLVFVHAEALREELLASHPVKAPVVVVPHGAQAASFVPLPVVPSLLFFGRMSHYKGLDTLLDAMPQVWRARPDVRLTIAGEGRLAPHEVLGDARVVVRNEHVPDDDVPGLFTQCTCVVLPYRQASQSGVGALAKRYGRAVVATTVGGLPELFNADIGRMVAPEDPQALGQAILEVVADRETAEELGRAAAASGASTDSWREVAALTLTAYRKHLLR